MKQTLQLKLGQQLTMTPHLQQAIKLLQLSTLELQAEVQDALDSNMMLEVDEEHEPVNGADRNAETVGPVDIPAELPTDSEWGDIYDGPVTSFAGGGVDSAFADFKAQSGDAETLHEHLYWQMTLVNFSDTDVLIAQAIIDAIDDDGYLTQSLEEIHEMVDQGAEEIELDEVEAVLRQVHNFDPVGVGARDLRECLLLQLAQYDSRTMWRAEAVSLVDGQLELLAGHDFQQLQRRLGLTRDQLTEVVTFIQSLHPRPGAQVSPPPCNYVVPDVFVRKNNGEWTVELNNEAAPKLRINSTYAGFIKRADNSADNNCLRTHLQEARWFLKSLKSRSDTLLKVVRCIVERQHLFLEYGDEAMKPLVLHDVAEAVDMHESTISRVTSRKYMHTPRGIYELRYFFSSHVSTIAGGEASSTAIRALIKKLIGAENPQKPLSDKKLAGILSESGIQVARRTVAKYRQTMTIPPSSDRKRLV